jgi:capsular polysaccharide biosynthesis protein
MQEENSLRDMIGIVWNGKWIIISVTIISMLIAGVYSFFTIKPLYEAESLVRIINDTGLLNSLIETTKSDVSLNKFIDKLQLNRDQNSINSLRSSINISLASETNVVKIKLSGPDPQIITDIANHAAFDLGARIEISDRAIAIVNAKNQLIVTEDSMVVNQSELEETQKQLANTPEMYKVTKVLADEPYLLSVVNDAEGEKSRNLGRLELISEEINPLHMTLKSSAAELAITLNKQKTEKKNLEDTISANQKKISDLDDQLNDEKLTIRNSERLLSDYNAIFISPAIESNLPVSSNEKQLNVVIAAVMGVMLSVMMVFMRYYWINGSLKKDQSITA